MVNIDEHLVKVIADLTIFLEYTNSDLLNEDAAVEAMEQLAGELQQMSEDAQQQLAKQLVALASSYNQPQREFVEGLPEALGLE
ncbi:MAG: hypothetical protein ABIS51_05915 [Sphingomonas sp.]